MCASLLASSYFSFPGLCCPVVFIASALFFLPVVPRSSEMADVATRAAMGLVPGNYRLHLEFSKFKNMPIVNSRHRYMAIRAAACKHSKKSEPVDLLKADDNGTLEYRRMKKEEEVALFLLPVFLFVGCIYF